MKSSESIGKIAPAFVKALAAMPGLRAEADNPYFGSKYVDLGALIRETRPILAAQELAMFQGVAGGSMLVEGQERAAVVVTTRLLHSSGEWFEETFTLPVQKRAGRKGKAAAEEQALPGVPTAQDLGSAVTYARRYSWGAFLGVASEEDDDGNQASGRNGRGGGDYGDGGDPGGYGDGYPASRGAPPPPPAPPTISPEEKARREERASLKRELGNLLEDPVVKPEERDAFRAEIEPKWKTYTNEDIKGFIARWTTLVKGRASRGAPAPAPQAPAAPAPAPAPAPAARGKAAAKLPPGAAPHEYSSAPPAETGAPPSEDDGLF